ncbi:MAG: tetratricopeptide repeat protein, partial [Bdellovibrionales bacterium]
MTGRRDRLQKVIFTSALGCALLLSNAHAQTAAKPVVQAEISHLGDTSHLEFKGLKSWRYEVQKQGPKKITLSIPPVDEASVARLKGFTDPLVDQVAIDKHGADGTYVVTFQLAQGDVESFDYLTDEPSRLIIDFYRKTEPEAKKQQPAAQTPAKASSAPATAAKKASAKRKEKSLAKNEDGYEEVPKEAQRRPAGDEVLSVDAPGAQASNADTKLRFGIFDGGDDNYDRFRIKDYEIREDSIISSRQNVYLPFPMLKMKVSQLDKLMEQQPEYVIHPKETRENKEARLLLTLFERKRYAVYLKTYEYFMNKYPETPYAEILKSITAHVHLQRWKDTGKAPEFEDARALYGELVQKYPESPLREHNYLILGFMQMERGDALNTLQTFSGFIKNYPASPEIPIVRKAVAEAYLILRKYDEAMAEYNTIIKDFPKTEHAQEARYRLGDVYFAKSDYTQAIRSYESAIKDLPAQEKIFPNANFNMAEARFWQKDFKKALGNYIQFVNLFPTHDFGGYALTRIGELLGVLGADQRRVMGAFLESYFRFPNHPGAKVARIRMLSQQMKGMKPKELKKALEEIAETSNKLDLPGIKEFTTLMMADGLAHRGEYKTAIEDLIAYYQKNPTSANLSSFKSRILLNISNELKDEVEHGEVMKGLAFYSQYANTWLKNTDRIDVPFLVGGAYERAGAYGEAQNIYREALQSRLAIVGTDVEKEKKVQEHLPSVASLHLRLAATLAQDRNYIDAHQELKAIGPAAELTPAETVERVQLSALIAEQRNDNQRAREALLELAQKWQGDPALVAPVHLKLAQIFVKLGDFK